MLALAPGGWGMRRAVTTRLWTVCLVGLLGCANDGGGEPVGMKIREGRAPAIGSTTVAIDALAPYERLVRKFETCVLEGNQIESTCPALLAFQTDIAGVSPKIQAEVGRRMIDHASPAVRVQAAAMMRAGGRLSPASLEAIARVAATERDPRVLEAFVRIAGKEGTTNPSAARLLLGVASHPDPGVRLDAIDAIAAVENRGMAGGAEKLVALAETDPDPRVRRAACESAGRLGNDSVLPLYLRTTEHVTDPDFYASCMEGLAAMFHNHPSFDTASEAAYRLFLRRLEATPRTASSPPWTVMSTFCYDSRETDPGALAAWKQRATWFDPREVRRVLASVITDRDASLPARLAAIESLAGLDAPPVEISNLRHALSQPADKPVADKLAALCD